MHSCYCPFPGIQIVSDEAGDYGMCNWGWDHINYANWNTLKISGSGSWLTVESYAYVNDISKMTLTIDKTVCANPAVKRP